LAFRVIAGATIFAAGVAAMAGAIPWLEDYTYPIVWWGLLLVLDALNLRRCGRTLAQQGWTHFLLITTPLSVLFWLFFELLNLPSPQWHYRGGIDNVYAQSLFGFVAFTTVLPIMAEFWWLAAGEQCVPARFAEFVRRWRWASVALGAAVAALPFINHVFWWNQGMWIAPALILLPFTDPPACKRTGTFVTALVLGGLMAGFVWELLNFWSRTHWEYLILRGAPHLFQMPLPGYVGFIPFAFAALAAYQFQLRIPTRPAIGVGLYIVALAALYILTTIYQQRGLWVLS
jgi:hypothetical protein